MTDFGKGANSTQQAAANPTRRDSTDAFFAEDFLTHPPKRQLLPCLIDPSNIARWCFWQRAQQLGNYAATQETTANRYFFATRPITTVLMLKNSPAVTGPAYTFQPSDRSTRVPTGSSTNVSAKRPSLGSSAVPPVAPAPSAAFVATFTSSTSIPKW